MSQPFEPQATVRQEPWPGNAEGTRRFTYPTMCQFIVEDGDLPEIKELASEALEMAGWPTSDRGKAQAILDYARRRMHYVSDAPLRDTVYRPRYLLCVKGAKLCVKIGDCSNMNCALGALMRAAGLLVKVQDIEYIGMPQRHVDIVVYLMDERVWVECDATQDNPVGHTSGGRKTVYDPHDPRVVGPGADAGAFIGAAGAYDGGMSSALSVRDAIFGRIGAGLVTPGDVLAYRTSWNQYVLDSSRVANECAQAYLGLAQQKQQSDPQTAQTLQGIGNAIQSASNALISDWNVWANTSNSTIVLQAATILQQQQQTVLEAGKVRDMVTTGTLKCQPTYVDSNGQVVQWIAGVDPSIQAQIIARIEGLGILASGILQILVESATNALIEAGSAAQWAANQAKATSSWLLSPWTPIIAGTLLVGTIGVVVYNADKVAKAASVVVPLAGARERKLRRRRRRRRLAA